QPLPGEQLRQVGVAEDLTDVATDLLGDVGVGRDLARLARPPAIRDRPVDPFLAAEVVRDQLLVDARSIGDLTDAGAGVPLRGELLDARVEDQPLGALGTALPVLLCRRTSGQLTRHTRPPS